MLRQINRNGLLALWEKYPRKETEEPGWKFCDGVILLTSGEIVHEGLWKGESESYNYQNHPMKPGGFNAFNLIQMAAWTGLSQLAPHPSRRRQGVPGESDGIHFQFADGTKCYDGLE